MECRGVESSRQSILVDSSRVESSQVESWSGVVEYSRVGWGGVWSGLVESRRVKLSRQESS